jgi:transposase
MLKPISMMLQTLKLFVKPSLDPNMRFVPVKTAEQQAVLALHRSRQSFIKQRTAQANQIRGYWPNLALSSPRYPAATATIT